MRDPGSPCRVPSPRSPRGKVSSRTGRVPSRVWLRSLPAPPQSVVMPSARGSSRPELHQSHCQPQTRTQRRERGHCTGDRRAGLWGCPNPSVGTRRALGCAASAAAQGPETITGSWNGVDGKGAPSSSHSPLPSSQIAPNPSIPALDTGRDEDLHPQAPFPRCRAGAAPEPTPSPVTRDATARRHQ